MANSGLHKIGLEERAIKRKRMRVSRGDSGRRGADRAQSGCDDSNSSGCHDQSGGARSPYGATLSCMRIARVPVQNAATDDDSGGQGRYGSHNIKRIDHLGSNLSRHPPDDRFSRLILPLWTSIGKAEPSPRCSGRPKPVTHWPIGKLHPGSSPRNPRSLLFYPHPS